MNNKTKLALISDLQEWWDVNKGDVIPEELAKIEFLRTEIPLTVSLQNTLGKVILTR